MSRLFALAVTALLLSACQAPPPLKMCSDYRVMTFSYEGITGWTDIFTAEVCVVDERKLTHP